MTSGTSQQKRQRLVGLPVVLGSASVWRRGLFERHFPEYGLDFMQADIDEKAIRNNCPQAMTKAIAAAKADALVSKLDGREVLLVTMDQVVCCDGEVREKPENDDQAREFLESYRQGKGAVCVNGVVVHSTKTGKRVVGGENATVYWQPFPDAVIDHLISRKLIFSSAGGFLVNDEMMAPYKDRVEGTLEAVEGLPVKVLRELLRLAAAPPVTHVLFDMDGLLLDTESAYTVAQQEIVGRWNKTFTWEVKAKMMGRKALEAAQTLIDDLELGDKITAADFVTEREQILDKLFAEAALLPGVEQLVRHLHLHGIPMAVATSSHRRHFELKTGRHAHLFGLMHHVVTGDQVAKSKPDPEIFIMAARLFEGEVPASSVLVFEDAPNGVQAANAAGMQVCHVPDPNLSRECRGEAFCELQSLVDFRPQDFGLPPFCDNTE
eukprot:TRINITY_DN76082_c0_g1_i1.p1 TRINITY_DN76082_c0_g1~~TRINITY_DN76082_c0_g1_i1.p1  ORF type:complete len:451 (+),score=91.88 TRINITY_DN76082_c0_g1_i1:47-1354(+)